MCFSAEFGGQRAGVLAQVSEEDCGLLPPFLGSIVGKKRSVWPLGPKLSGARAAASTARVILIVKLPKSVLVVGLKLQAFNHSFGDQKFEIKLAPKVQVEDSSLLLSSDVSV